MFFVSKKKFNEMKASKEQFKAIAENALDKYKACMEHYEKTLEELYTQRLIVANLKQNHAKAIFSELDRPLDKLILKELSIEAFVNEYMKMREHYLGDKNDL